MQPGVLALQGDFEAHAAMLRREGVEPVEVRVPDQLEALDGLVLPGGESTTLLNLMQDAPWFDALRRFHARGRAVLATCAGAILVSRDVTGPAQRSLGLIDAAIERNAYGRQIDSFECELDGFAGEPPLHAVFIRAPRFSKLGAGIEVLARRGDEPVLVRQGAVVAATFHPELTDDGRVHRLFLELAAARRLVTQ